MLELSPLSYRKSDTKPTIINYQNYYYRIQAINAPVYEMGSLTYSLWQNKPEGLCHAVIFTIAFHLEKS